MILTRCIKCYKIAGALLRPLPDKETDETGPIHWRESVLAKEARTGLAESFIQFIKKK